MAYIAKRDKRVNDLRWLYIDDSDAVLEIEGVRYCEEVANKSGTELCSIEYARETFDEVALFEFLDWQVEENKRRGQAVRKCEILVPDHLPFRYFEARFPRI
jgi:hypothetical protein